MYSLLRKSWVNIFWNKVHLKWRKRHLRSFGNLHSRGGNPWFKTRPIACSILFIALLKRFIMLTAIILLFLHQETAHRCLKLANCNRRGRVFLARYKNLLYRWRKCRSVKNYNSRIFPPPLHELAAQKKSFLLSLISTFLDRKLSNLLQTKKHSVTQ